MFKFAVADRDHVREMAPNVRECDRMELWAAAHVTPEEGLMACLRDSDVSCVALSSEDKPVAIFGVTVNHGEDGTVASPWMIGTQDAERDLYGMLVQSRTIIKAMVEHHGHLMNYVDARNEKAIKWLKHLGFMFFDAEPYGPEGLPFYRFEMWR